MISMGALPHLSNAIWHILSFCSLIDYLLRFLPDIKAMHIKWNVKIILTNMSDHISHSSMSLWSPSRS